MKRLARTEIFHLVCFKKHFKASENVQKYKIQSTARQKIKIRRGLPHSLWQKVCTTRTQAHTRSQTRACTKTHTNTHSHVLVFLRKI